MTKTKGSDLKAKTKKRKLIDEKFMNDTALISSIEEFPSKEYDIPQLVPPKDNTVDLNKDESITFEIRTNEFEYCYFNRDYQIQLEMSVYQQDYDDSLVASEKTLLSYIKKPIPPTPEVGVTPVEGPDKNGFAFAPCTSGLSIFKNVSVSYMNHTKDETLTFPQDGIFLNNVTAQDFYFSGHLGFEKIQNSLNNFTPNNTLRLGDDQSHISPKTQKMRYAKIHKTKTDAPVIPDVARNSAGGSKVGKMHYIYISRTPFVANNPYLQQKYNLQSAIIFPPNSTIRIVLYKTDVPLKFLGINKEVDINNQIENAQITDAAWLRKKLEYYIHSINLVIHRVKLDPKHIMPSKYFNNITVNNFDLVELTNSTSQKIPINWRSQETPVYIVLSFIRQQDVIFSNNTGLPQALNQFFLPKNLTTLTVRQQNYINEVFDGLKIENLHEQDYHKSKCEYIQYLRKHRFVPLTFKFEDMFSIDDSYLSGASTLFPIDLVGREIQGDPHNRGLEVELLYNSPNDTKWFLCVRYVYIGQLLMDRQPDKQYKVDFKYT